MSHKVSIAVNIDIAHLTGWALGELAGKPVCEPAGNRIPLLHFRNNDGVEVLTFMCSDTSQVQADVYWTPQLMGFQHTSLSTPSDQLFSMKPAYLQELDKKLSV